MRNLKNIKRIVIKLGTNVLTNADSSLDLEFFDNVVSQISQLRKKGINLHKVNRIDYPFLKNEPYIWTLANKVSEVAQNEGIDLIHAHYAIPHALVAYVAREELKSKGIKIHRDIVERGAGKNAIVLDPDDGSCIVEYRSEESDDFEQDIICGKDRLG